MCATSAHFWCRFSLFYLDDKFAIIVVLLFVSKRKTCYMLFKCYLFLD